MEQGDISSEAAAKRWAAFVISEFGGESGDSERSSAQSKSMRSAKPKAAGDEPVLDGQMDPEYSSQQEVTTAPCSHAGSGVNRVVDTENYYFRDTQLDNCQSQGGYLQEDGRETEEEWSRDGFLDSKSIWVTDGYYLAKNSASGVEGDPDLTHKSLEFDGFLYEEFTVTAAAGHYLTAEKDLRVAYGEVYNSDSTTFITYTVGDSVEDYLDGRRVSEFNGFVAFDNVGLDECLVGSFEFTTERAEVEEYGEVVDGGRYILENEHGRIVVDYDENNEPRVYHNGQPLNDLPAGSGRCRIKPFVPGE